MKQPVRFLWLIIVFLTYALTGCLTPPGPKVETLPAETSPAEPQPVPAAKVEVALVPAQVNQGDFFAVRLNAKKGLPVGGARLEGWTPQVKFFSAPNGAVALAAVDPEARPGKYQLKVVLGETVRPMLLEVKAKRFTESRLTMPKETAGLRVDPRVPAERQEVLTARSRSSPEALWEGDFISPAQGEISTYFGEKRIVNGEPDGWHNGTDIANLEGTSVVAANSGRVVLARRLVMTGDTVIIDHGLNVFTSYSHLSTLKVSSGQAVKKGQAIGLMGGTGYSTGSHLHWVASIGNASVNPQSLISSDALPR